MNSVDSVDDLAAQIRACWLSAIEKLDHNELVTLMDDYSASLACVARQSRDAVWISQMESRIHDLVDQMGYLEATGGRD